MTDDDRLHELFHAAATDTVAPPPFDHSDIVTASRRITARRRSALVGGLGVLAFVGIGAGIVLPDHSRTAGSTAAAPAVASDSAGGDRAGAEVAPPGAEIAPGVRVAPGAGSDVPFSLQDVAPPGVPLGPGTTPCADPQDPQLRALVEQVLPEVIGAPELATTEICREGGGRGMSVEVEGGLLTVSYLPPGESAALPDGSVGSSTASGGTVVIDSRAATPGGSVPFEGRLDTTAAFLAQRL